MTTVNFKKKMIQTPSEDRSVIPEVDPRNRLDGLFEKGMLVSVTCSGPSFRLTNTCKDLGFSNQDVSALMNLGNTVWIPKRVLNARDKIFGQAYRLPEKYAIKFEMLKGCYFIPFAAMADFEVQFQEIRKSLRVWLVDFKNNKQSYYAEVLNDLEKHEHFLILRDKVRQAQNLKSDYDIETSTAISFSNFYITFPNDLEEKGLSEAFVLEAARKRGLELGEAEVADIRLRAQQESEKRMKAAQKAAEDLLEATSAKYVAIFEDEFTTICRGLSRSGKLTPGNARKFKDVLDIMRNINITGSVNIDEQLNRLDREFSKLTSGKPSSNAISEFKTTVQQAFQNISDQDRYLDLDS
jgi:hypothetical protein